MSKNKFIVKDKRVSTPNSIYKADQIKNEEALAFGLPQPGETIPKAPDYKKIGMKILDRRVLFQNFPLSKKIGAIFMPRVGDVYVEMARVVAAGSKVENCKVGDIIYKMASMGQTLLTPEGTFQFLPDDCIIAVIDPENAVLIPPIKDDAA